jgi:hypothetical protein
LVLGVTTSRFELDTATLSKLVSDSNLYLVPADQYRNVRWHDIVVLLLLRRVATPGSSLEQYAASHLNALAHVNSGMLEYYNSLSARNFS